MRAHSGRPRISEARVPLDAASGGGRALEPIARPRLYEELVRRLLAYIQETGLAVGDRMPPERDLAERLGVSRASVRQAIVVLDVQGVVHVRQGGGTYVRRIPTSLTPLHELLRRKRRLPEVLETREALEVKVAELAAIRRTSADLAAIDHAVDWMAAKVEAGEMGADADRAFHTAIAEASKNAILTGVIESLAQPIEESRLESLSQPGRPHLSLQAHRSIATAVLKRDPVAAGTAMRSHLMMVADVRLLHWKPQQE